MGQPIDFPGTNCVWRGWEKDDDRPAVADLRCISDGSYSTSCWRMTWRERLYVLFRGRVWLSVIGTHPPVSVFAKNPFKK